ncbi:MAG: hypothetical protein IJM45_06245 [Clostridia bacterium]|nr:hypothetical protein [Clostridia bacterium]
MKRTLSACLASLAAIAGSELFFYSFSEWFPVLYAVSVVGILEVADEYNPDVKTGDPLLCGCFTEKNGSGKAFVFTNMYEPQNGKEAAFSATFPGAKSVTVYRRGETSTTAGDTFEMTLESREGVFVTVEY